MTPEGELASVVHRNIEALLRRRRELERRTPVEQRVANAITAFTGSMPFVYLHLLLFGGWLVLNSGVVPGIEPWDPFPFVMLAMWASVEAIFLSTFVLISQNQQAAIAERRAELDLQINLLSEHEITKLVELVEAIARTVGAPVSTEELQELEQDVRPEEVLQVIEEVEVALRRRDEGR